MPCRWRWHTGLLARDSRVMTSAITTARRRRGRLSQVCAASHASGEASVWQVRRPDSRFRVSTAPDSSWKGIRSKASAGRVSSDVMNTGPSPSVHLAERSRNGPLLGPPPRYGSYDRRGMAGSPYALGAIDGPGCVSRPGLTECPEPAHSRRRPGGRRRYGTRGERAASPLYEHLPAGQAEQDCFFGLYAASL